MSLSFGGKQFWCQNFDTEFLTNGTESFMNFGAKKSVPKNNHESYEIVTVFDLTHKEVYLFAKRKVYA